MLFFSGWGWLLPLTWLAIVLAGTELSNKPYDISLGWAMWMATIALSAVAWILGRSAKKKYTIYWRFSASKTARVSRHSFMFIPVEFWVWFAPVIHLAALGFMGILSYFNI